MTTLKAAVFFCLVALLPARGHAEGFDTEHIFGFMIGTDVGEVGEREFQSETTGRFGRDGGAYRSVGQQVELEFVPVPNFRIEAGTTFAGHAISAVPGFDDRHQFTWQGASLDLRYRFLEREAAPFGLTLAVEGHGDRIDEITGAAARSYGTDVTLAIDREVIPNAAIAAVNLLYQPEWTHFTGRSAEEQEATIGAAFALMTRVRPNVLFGAEARYFRKYDGIGLNEFEGQAFFIGPNVYLQLSERARLTATWSVQAWGRAAGAPGPALDLVNFERHQARLVFGVNF